MSTLWQVYEEHSAFGGVPISEFIRGAQKGEYGEFSADELVELLETLLDSVLENIEMMAASNPALADVADERKEDQNLFYRKLIVEVRDRS